ncbi:universal stress protein [Thermostaphylospora chromogena]|uniref:Nucleotide-binding universal stress protein, UspA family n=1 Tax=Thermostaphylospora chromogena TaxID=35622 RepID=A0A1H1GZS8_9ACTN|nr:universal stress protein [Thermostaphylospora chromogena]SDR18684.1 Nucleotide-binding universal stress protein, UspA family [Thermostaphylospora chromogena]
MTDHVAVGVDGSLGSAEAVEWAVDDAVRRGLPLRIVHVADLGPYELPVRSSQTLADAQALNATRVLADAEMRARKRAQRLEIDTEVLNGAPVRVLREVAKRAVELVIGHRGAGGFAGALLGSVCMQVAGHAHGTVVVVRAVEETRPQEVVVGVDGSENSHPALDYAFEQARLREGALRALHAWQPPSFAFIPNLSSHELDDLRRVHQELLEEQIAPWRESHPQVGVVPDLWCAHPVEALTEASGRARLVVVGSHGRGALRGTLLGSVSRALLARAACPVAVIRPRQ